MISPSEDPFSAASLPPLAIDVYTAAYRVSGTTRTRFQRVADVLNQLPGAHLVVDQATVSEYADPSGTLSAQQVLVSVAEILFMLAGGAEPEARPEMRIPKRAVRAQLALPPFRLTGAIHVPQGSRPTDGLLNASDRFLTMTDVTIGCGAYSEHCPQRAGGGTAACVGASDPDHRRRAARRPACRRPGRVDRRRLAAAQPAASP